MENNTGIKYFYFKIRNRATKVKAEDFCISWVVCNRKQKQQWLEMGVLFSF